MIRRGCSRTVFLVRTWAIKVPSLAYGFSKFLLGWYSNRTEADRWGWSEYAIGNVFCPVLGCYLGGLVLVMRRAERVTIAEFDALSAVELGPLRAATSDLHEENVGRLDGRLVLVDYASG